MGLVLRKVALWAVACAALLSGCEGKPVPTAAQTEQVIQERDAVARQYWAATRAFQRAPLGFKARLEVAVGSFTACDSGGQQYQIVAVWEPVGAPPAVQGGLVQQAVPAIERAFNGAGWGQFQPSPSIALNVVATRPEFTLSLDADPANPGPDERDWTPIETYTVAGSCIGVTAQAAAELEAVGKEYYGTAPAPLPPIPVPDWSVAS